jgi:hypothetical protein
MHPDHQSGAETAGGPGDAQPGPVSPPVEFGCDYCADDQNRWYGHVKQLAASPDREMILSRCPRAETLYENTPDGEDMTRRLTEADAASLYPDFHR